MKTRKHLINLLDELSNLEESFFKSRAYKNAVLTLNQISDEEFDNCNDFTDYEGIGSGINKKILEYKETGKISKLESLRQENKNSLDPTLYKIRKSFVTKRIPYELATNYIDKLKSEVPDITFTVAGSYRRKKSLIGDLDILVTPENYSKLYEVLSSTYEVLSSGEYKSSYLIDKINNIQLDVISVPKSELPFQLLYLTGSKEFNIRMRAQAKKLGYTLNQEGLYNIETQSYEENLNTEEDVFNKLNMIYTSPELR